MAAITEQDIRIKLESVMDPEMNMSIVDLGLVYTIDIKENEVYITMTLTTLGCPLFHLIEQEIKSNMAECGFSEEQVHIELTFDPPWSMDNMSEKAKAILGI